MKQLRGEINGRQRDMTVSARTSTVHERRHRDECQPHAGFRCWLRSRPTRPCDRSHKASPSHLQPDITWCEKARGETSSEGAKIRPRVRSDATDRRTFFGLRYLRSASRGHRRVEALKGQPPGRLSVGNGATSWPPSRHARRSRSAAAGSAAALIDVRAAVRPLITRKTVRA